MTYTIKVEIGEGYARVMGLDEHSTVLDRDIVATALRDIVDAALENRGEVVFCSADVDADAC